MTKAETRKVLLAARKQAHEAEAPGPIPAMIAWLRARLAPGARVGTYRPIRTERDPGPVHTALAQHHNLAFPRVMGPDEPLSFFCADQPEDFEVGSFGVLEPKADLPTCVPDLILVPLVGFDAAGYRLGYGGGFYDRTLAKFRAMKALLAVGYAYDGQLSTAPLNFEATDLALDAVMTPTQVYDFAGGGQTRPWL